MKRGGAGKQAQWHKRLMLGATILFVAGPGFSRIPLAPPIFWGFTIQLLLEPDPVRAAVHLGPAHAGKSAPGDLDRLCGRRWPRRSCRWR